MVQDTLVGVLGAVLIVGSMVVAIDAQDISTPGEGEVTDAPSPIGKSVWRASSCEALTLTWAPPLEDLGEITGPHTPAEGPLPGRGEFQLVVFDCRQGSLDGLSISPPTGGSALVAVEEPENPRNVTASDGWMAVASQYGSPDSRLADVFEEHGFDYVDAHAAVSSTSTPLGDQVGITLDPPGGYLEATVTVTGSASERSAEQAFVGTDEDTFSVFAGEEGSDRRSQGAATVTTQGTTWVERLGLAPSPVSVAYDTNRGWNVTFQHEPWDPAGGEGTNATLAGSVAPASDLAASRLDRLP